MTASTTIALQGLYPAHPSPSSRAPLGTTPVKKPILRAHTSVLEKRKRTDDLENSPQESPSKRLKHVTFDLDSTMTVDIGSRSLEETKREIQKALDDRRRGEPEGYENIKQIFQNDRQKYLPPVAGEEDDCLRPQELAVYVVALSNCARLLDRSCSDLIRAVLKCSWLGRDDHFYRAYTQFLAALVSAQGSALEMVLSMVVEKFKEHRESAWNTPDFPAVDLETAQTRLHGALGYLLRLFPSARSVLCNLLGRHFPYLDESKRVHTTYVDNLLRLKGYAPELGLDIMELIIDRLVKIDVQMQFDLEDMDDELTARIVNHLHKKQAKERADSDGPDGEVGEDEDEEDSDAESIASDDSDYDEEAKRIETGAATVEKMDAIMDTLFELYNREFASPDSDEARSCLEDMISDFVNLILPTYKSRHTQFLVFHFSQFSPRLTDLFVGTLFSMAFESNRPMALRQSATAYLASYVARGGLVAPEMVRNVVDLLCHHVDAQLQNHLEGCRGPDLRRYKHLYSLVQALLYIFCFRWRELVTDAPDIVDRDDDSSYIGHELGWLPGFRESMSRIIHSKFNPLKVCSPEIVHEFARLAHSFRFMYVYPLLENNKRVHLAQFVTGDYSTGGALRDSCCDPFDEGGLQLEAYFPFDPYQLPVSKRWIGDDYMKWRTITALDKKEEEEEEEQQLEIAVEDSDVEADELDEEGVEEQTATEDENDDD